jgi:dTDP-4-dehydrorhamnose 3,5-epimerase
MSNKNVIRGLHFQYPNYQAKLIRVVKGKILDVCVDLNKNSPTYLQHTKIELSDENGLCLFVPTKYAHGCLSLEDNTIVNYKCSNYYYPNEQFGIIWNDKSLNINWGINKPLLSKKDLNLPPLKGIK